MHLPGGQSCDDPGISGGQIGADEAAAELYPDYHRPPAWYLKFTARDAARFYAKVGREDEESGCILWIGTVNRHGYGVFGHDRTTRPAHQVAMLEAGIYPPDEGGAERYVAHHTCENKLCVNPYHCEWVTEAEHADRHRELAFIRADLDDGSE